MLIFKKSLEFYVTNFGQTYVYEIVRLKKDQVFPEGHIAPGTLIANTDTKHYQHLVSKIYRQRSLTILLHDIDIFQVHPGLYHKK